MHGRNPKTVAGHTQVANEALSLGRRKRFDRSARTVGHRPLVIFDQVV